MANEIRRNRPTGITGAVSRAEYMRRYRRERGMVKGAVPAERPQAGPTADPIFYYAAIMRWHRAQVRAVRDALGEQGVRDRLEFNSWLRRERAAFWGRGKIGKANRERRYGWMPRAIFRPQE